MSIRILATIGIRAKGMKYDPDAANFFYFANITDPNTRDAVNYLTLAAKENLWWGACNIIYPFVGGTADSNSYNLKNPYQFKITWSGSLTHNSNGVTGDGSTGYGNTNCNISTSFDPNNAHLSTYSRTNNTIFGYEVAAYDSTVSPNIGMILSLNEEGSSPPNPTSAEGSISGRGVGLSILSIPTTSYWMVSRTASNAIALYRTGSLLTSNTFTNSSTNPTFSLAILARNLNNTISAYSNRNQAFITAGSGINSTLALTMYNDIQNFQTALGRQVSA